ncbi:acyl-CoA N-acyltransferase [Tilletiaria anomala UBC 951]|uniref:Acyl-CoA N-acyltransferase n=1 Tax=Tilletiaria anomala (strain ATCC 24038 / CBS 436.72 / UBC 951) TaxID=1037660 RepID=A0A066V4H3_TILAU|nr:acyl-CoA N-acyltransferase [Tilletiaria anomala UBC 951]KDN36326.1 acyl-CoA N-acyltransferase [Tilletiaria anomala UBC 951]
MNDHWTYLPYHRPSSRAEFDAWLQERRATRPDPFIYAIVDSHGEAQGIIAYLNGSPKNGSIETGHVLFGPNLQHTKLATEAQCALAKHAFEDLGYKRLEWKCDSLNVHSKRAAERLGYSYEGLFRSHWIYKGRGRDTIWLAMVDYDWPVIKRGFETWLAPENFDKHSRQVRNLEACRKQAVTDMKANENAP